MLFTQIDTLFCMRGNTFFSLLFIQPPLIFPPCRSLRLAFVNKLDRAGANPWKVINGLRTVLALNAAAVQIPIGLEEKHEGVVDLIEGCSYYCRGEKGEHVVRDEGFPAEYQELYDEKRAELIERIADVDDEVVWCPLRDSFGRLFFFCAVYPFLVDIL